MTLPPARAASTVVLMRPSRRGFEVLLVQRHDNIAFMGGAHVFPGGRVNEADRIDRPERICDGVVHATARMPGVDPIEVVAYHVAAIRELFEEAGVLLARPAVPPRVLDRRHDVERGTLTLEELARREGLRLALDDLEIGRASCRERGANAVAAAALRRKEEIKRGR